MFNTDFQKIQNAYVNMIICESNNPAIKKLDEEEKSVKEIYNKLSYELSKARLFGGKEDIKRLNEQLAPYVKRLNEIDDERKAAENAAMKADVDRMNKNLKIHNNNLDFNETIKKVETLPGKYSGYYNSNANSGTKIDDFANKHGTNGEELINRYTAMRRNGFGVGKGKENNIDYDALAAANNSAKSGKYGDALDGIAKDLTQQYGLNSTSATNNLTYQNLKSKLNDGYLPSTDEFGNALGSLMKYGSESEK